MTPVMDNHYSSSESNYFSSGSSNPVARAPSDPFYPPPSRGPSQYPPGGMSMGPAQGAQFGGNQGSNGPSANVARYQPPQRRQYQDSIVRPESSISNMTFGGQGMYTPSMYGNVQMPPRTSENHRTPHPTRYPRQDVGMGSLGAGLGQLRLSAPPPQYQAPSTTGEGNYTYRRDSKTSTASSNSTSKPQSSSTARYLAGVIKSGATEDPFDRSMSRYDTPPKVSQPSLGPARFNNSKMFSTASGPTAMPVATSNSVAPPQHSLDPRTVPDWLDMAQRGLYKPSVDEAIASIPFMELYRGVSPPTAGVIRINDIPYQTTRAEIIAFVGRNAQIARLPEGSPYHAVHIMMERETGKTMDCFVEFSTPGEAAWVCRQFTKRVEQGRPPKVGDRIVEVVYTSQDEFLSLLFPRAKHVHWSNGQPIIDSTVRQYYPGKDAQGFKGFIHSEEFTQLTKHAGLSERSPFASKSPCRVFEHMITTLLKYPWYAVNHITVGDRRALYECTTALLRILVETLRKSNGQYSPLEPSQALLQELVIAALSCPGFSEKQKATIIQKLYQFNFKGIAEGQNINVKLGGHSEFSGCWPFATLSPVPGTDKALLKCYANLFREATASSESNSLASRMAAEASGGNKSPLANVTPNYGPNASNLTLAKAAAIEWGEVERLLKKVCNRSGSSTPASNSGNPYGAIGPGSSGRRSETSNSGRSSGNGNGGSKSITFW